MRRPAEGDPPGWGDSTTPAEVSTYLGIRVDREPVEADKMRQIETHFSTRGGKIMSETTSPDLLTFDQTCERTTISRQGIYRRLETDPTFPDRIWIGGSVRFKASEIDAWLAARERAGRLKAYSVALAKDGLSGVLNGALVKGRKLGYGPEEVELHRLVFSEHSRLKPLADLEEPEKEMNKAFERPADTGHGLDLRRSEQQRAARVRLSEARHAANQISAIEAYFSALFGLDIQPSRAARGLLPPPLREKIREIEAAKIRAETPPEEIMSDADKLRLR